MYCEISTQGIGSGIEPVKRRSDSLSDAQAPGQPAARSTGNNLGEKTELQ